MALTFRQLEVFVATVRAGSLTQAARDMYISQPSASRLIADLEYKVGFKLFEREGGRMKPSPEGLKFYEDVVKSFTGREHLEKVAREIREDRAGRLSITTVPALSIHFVPQLIARFRRQHPDVSVSVKTLQSGNVLTELRLMDTDLAFVSRMPEMAEVAQETLVDADFICALPPGHRLADRQIIHAHDLAGENIITLDPIDGFYWRGHARVFLDMQIDIRSNLSTQSSSTAYAMVSQGLAVGILEPFSAPVWEKTGVLIRPFRPSVKYSFSICFPSFRSRSDLALAMAKMARSAAQRLRRGDI